MFHLIFLCISVTYINLISSSYLVGAKNFLDSETEGNKRLTKGVWINNNKHKDDYEKNTGDFIFRGNSQDVDNLLQNNFDAFAESFMQGSPGFANYVERNKRSSEYERKKLIRESLKCNGDKKCAMKKLEDKSLFVKSKMMSKLRPASVFNDYPYEVAIMLGDNKINTPNIKRKVKESGDINQLVIPLSKNKESSQTKIDPIKNKEAIVGDVIKYNDSESNSNSPKRSMNNDYESEVIKKIEYTEEIDNVNDKNDSNKVAGNVLDKGERGYYQYNPTVQTRHDTNPSNIEPQRNKPINERGMIKVLSMLTKTFKKIMKQHNDIRKIHSKLSNLNVDITKNIENITKKFADIEQKYDHIVELSNEIKQFETKMDTKEEYFKMKDIQMTKNLEEFQNQQKKFLTQQRQFYNIQKLMLEQNEKINLRQNVIAKTQSEISHRQYNFARILKKAKQIYIENKFTGPTKLVATTSKPVTNMVTSTETPNTVTHTTTQEPYSTDSIKINLFSIPALDKLVNQDKQILKEKDESSVDDLVYKYYFNNTFIDNLMKSRVLSNFMTTGENTEIARNAKSKRDEEIIENTILSPVKNNGLGKKSNREKRWIRHAQSKTKLKRKLRGKHHNIVNEDVKDERPIRQKNLEQNKLKLDSEIAKLFSVKNGNDPFLVMAESFCNEIGQNGNDQILHWCIEKSLRRLQYLDFKLPFTIPSLTDKNQQSTIAITNAIPAEDLNKVTVPNEINNKINLPNNERVSVREASPSSTTVTLSSSYLPSSITAQTASETSTDVYFPDNDELEFNLKQYELKPDTEGNVYYDGSVHTSDIVLDEGLSDIMTGLESNSRVALDPLILDLQAIRLDPRRRIEELKKLAYG